MAQALQKTTDLSSQQWLVDSCLSRPTSPILHPEKLRHGHSSQSDFHTELLGTLQPPHQHIKITTVVMVSKIYFIWTSYGKSLDAAFLPKILSNLEAAVFKNLCPSNMCGESS